MHRFATVPILFLAAAVLALPALVGCGGGGGGGPGINQGQQTYNLDLLWSPNKLFTEMQSNPALVVLDCRQKTSRADGSVYIPYNDEHITGSHYINFFDFGDPYPSDQAKIEATLSALGITTETTICLYDIGIANPQGKVFFNLERQGCTDVHMLDGGFPVWKNAGYPVSAVATPAPAPSNFLPRIDNTCYAELPEMKQIFDIVDSGLPHNYTLVDYREPDLYWGHKICPDAVRTGRMPHCGLLDWHDFFDASTGRFLPPAEIEARSVAVGQTKNKINVVICNKGWRTGISYFALRYIGWPKSSIIHYVGGIREWTFQDEVEYPMITEACYDVGCSLPPGNNWAKRFAGACAQVGSEVYCIGGYCLSNPQAEPYSVTSTCNQAYDIPTDTWRDALAPLPEPLAFTAAAADSSGYIYVIGGIDAWNGTMNTKVFRYDTVMNVWDDGTVETPLPEGHFSFAAVSVNDKIYVTGGLTGFDKAATANYSNKAYVYDIAGKTWTALPDLPQGRRCHAMVAIGDLVYVIAGFYYNDVTATGIDLRDIWALDTTNVGAGWVRKDGLPMDIAGHSAAAANGKIYVLGGWSVEGIKYDVLEYDPALDSSRIMKKDGRSASIGWPRYWYFIGTSGDLITSIGGFGGGPGNIEKTPNDGMTHFNQTYVYDLSNTFDP